MGRPRVHATPRSATAIRFPTDLLERLHVESDARGVSVNWLVNRAVERFLADLLPVDEMILTRAQMLRAERDSTPSRDSDRDASRVAVSGRTGGSDG